MATAYDRWLEEPCTDGGDLDELIEDAECCICGGKLDEEAERRLIDYCASAFDPEEEARTARCTECRKKEDGDEE